MLSKIILLKIINVLSIVLLPLTGLAEVLQSGESLAWRKGNLHTHSHWSDGDDYIEAIALWYKNHGYNFVSFSEHNVLPVGERWVFVDETKGGRLAYSKLKRHFPSWIDEAVSGGRPRVRLRQMGEVNALLAEPDVFLLIQGEEISTGSKSLPVHVNATNLQKLITPSGGQSIYETIQNAVNSVIAQRETTGQPILVHVAHPNYKYAVSAEDLMRVQGGNFFEVYNGHHDVHNSGDLHHRSIEESWDLILTHRIASLNLPLMYGLAVDDSHSYHDTTHVGAFPGRGWVMVLTNKLTPDALIDALEKGRFYASTGVILERIAYTSNSMEVSIAAKNDVDYVIEFIGTRSPSEGGLGYGDVIGETLRSVQAEKAIYKFRGNELYVRARITSSRTHPNPSEPGEAERAWTQPVRGPGAVSVLTSSAIID